MAEAARYPLLDSPLLQVTAQLLSLVLSNHWSRLLPSLGLSRGLSRAVLLSSRLLPSLGLSLDLSYNVLLSNPWSRLFPFTRSFSRSFLCCSPVELLESAASFTRSFSRSFSCCSPVLPLASAASFNGPFTRSLSCCPLLSYHWSRLLPSPGLSGGLSRVVLL